MAGDSGRLTLLDFLMNRNPDGSPAQAVNLMTQFNPILQDAPAFPSNAPLGNRTTFVRALPSVGTARINKGVTRSKSTTDQRTDPIGYFAGRSEIDSRLRKTLGAAAFERRRLEEDQRFEEALSQLVVNNFFYGNVANDEASFNGFAPRLNALNGDASWDMTASNVFSNETVSGGDGTSIYIVDWGERTAHLIYPMDETGGSGGLDIQDKGEVSVPDSDGNPMFAYVTTYDWMVGLTVKDPRRIARLANIDLSAAYGATPTVVFNALERILSQMPTPPRGTEGGGRRVLYCATRLWAAIAKQARAAVAGATLSMQEYLGQPTPHIWNFPLRQVDQIATNEATVS